MERNAENVRVLLTRRQVDQIRSSLPLRVRWLCWAVKAGVYLSQRSDGTVNRRLAAWLIWCLAPPVPANEIPKHGVYTRDAVIDHVNGVWVRLFVPVQENGDETEVLPVVVYFHGGGFCTLSAAEVGYDVFCRRLAKRRRVVVVSVDYRLAPEHKFPVAYEDCYAALLWLRNDHAENRFLPRGADVSRCFLMGESAGGNIVHHVGCRVAEGKEDLTPMNVVGHVLIQPFFGGEERTPSELALTDVPLISVDACDWSWRAFLPEGANRDHPAANVVGPGGADISAVPLPKSLVVIGGLDTLRDWQLRYFDYLKKMKKEVGLMFYENGVHGFPLMPYDLSSDFIDDISDFMQR
ncbi:hypothetical protein SUGI_0889170 [Cryptomeria japonica]|uniref:probable carboxylesterase 18 n=1 Tax=Cryptomeria japonica TaxID=3369 RepID=UPI00241469B3|nr:probable carboxylesterase 18 [Cryptomeria japonica]GLJ42900.1 hypothetical protein SUGI_0889170 [Cryptomeria japonica]